MNRWLEVTIPLTLLTLILAYAGKRWAEKASHPEDLNSGYKQRWGKLSWTIPWNRSFPVRSQSTEKLYV